MDHLLDDGFAAGLAGATLRGTVLLLLAWVAAVALRRSSAAVRHRVWSLALVGLIALPFVMRVGPAWRVPILPGRPPAAGPASPPTAPSASPEVVAPAERPREPGVGAHAPVASEGPPPVAPRRTSEIGPDRPHIARGHAAAAAPWRPADVVRGAWAAGLVVTLLPTLAGLIGGEVRRRRAAALTDDRWAALLSSVCETYAIGRHVELRRGGGSLIPLTWGVVRPVILMPEQSEAWTDETRRLVLMHELAHVRRWDVAWLLLGRLAAALYWFHPLAWHAVHRLRDECESACDDCVVAAGARPSDYARQLLDLARSLRRPRFVAGVPMARTNFLEERMMAMFDTSRSHAALGRRPGRVLVTLAGLAVIGLAAIQPGPAGRAADQAAPRDGGDRPKIVRVDPADGATDVNPVTEIRIRFDRPMDPTSAALDWKGPGQAGYRLRGEMRYSPDTFEFALPVHLTPGRKHEVAANREGTLGRKAYEGFRSADGVDAAIHSWSFTTAQPADARGGPPPRIVSVDPPPDTEVAILTRLEVTFDRPMEPSAYGLGSPDDEPSAFDRIPKVMGRVEYAAPARRFTLLLKLPEHWNGEVQLKGFRGADGVPAEPINLKYRTLRQRLSPGLQRRIEQASQGASPELRRIIEQARSARRGLKSISEQVLTTMTLGGRSDWRQRYDLKESRFRMQGDRKFVGDIDLVMGVPFRVGSDGTTCWFRSEKKLVQLPFDQVEEKNLLFCDPFDANGAGDVERLIRDRKLEYVGEANIRGRRCYQIRSHDIRFITADVTTPMHQWSIDAETFLPARVEIDDALVTDYLDIKINEPIPDAEFRPAVDPGVQAEAPEPLPEGYTRRFLNVNDGTGGRMSVRWGMKGPKGTNSSGLN